MSQSKYAKLAYAARDLEMKIFAHASLNQVETVESFLKIIVAKSGLTGEISLMADWDEESIKRQTVYISISAQNEIVNMPHVEKVFTGLIALQFKYVKFYKYIESRPVFALEDLSVTIETETKTPILLNIKNLRFHVARY